MKVRLCLLLLTTLFATSCLSSSNLDGNHQETNLLLQVDMFDEESPLDDYGQVVSYRLQVSSTSWDQPLEKFYDLSQTKVQLSSLTAGDVIVVTLEALNSRQKCLYRARSEVVEIQTNEETIVELSFQAVPSFTNLKNGAVIAQNRLVPEVYAPQELNFEIQDGFEGSLTVLEDQNSGLTEFSVNPLAKEPRVKVFVPNLSLGWHDLRVQDSYTAEFEQIRVLIVSPSKNIPLLTSSGGLLGLPSPIDVEASVLSSLIVEGE